MEQFLVGFLCIRLIGAFPTNGDPVDLLSVLPTSGLAASICCLHPSILSCSPVSLEASALGRPGLSLPGGIEVDFRNFIANDPNAYSYGSKEAEAVLTYNPDTRGLHGHVMTTDGRSFVIENCGAEGHVWKQLDVETFGEDLAVHLENETQDFDKHLTEASDNTTKVVYSIKVYYTPEFAKTTPDIFGFLAQAIAETNQGYANSEVPLEARICSQELATIHDMNDGHDLLHAFSELKPTVADIRGSADVAVLLADYFDLCGVAYFNTLSSKKNLAVVRKSCAVGYYSLGHEIGHNFALKHNIESAQNPDYPYGHGKLIAKGTAGTGVRSIEAYTADGHKTRVNYYSNPSVIFPGTGTPTGDTSVANNAAVLLLNRFSMSAMGDESECWNVQKKIQQ